MNGSDTVGALLKLMGDIFGSNPGKLSADTKQGDIEEWDSFGHLRLFMSIEQAFNVKFTMEEISALGNVRDIARRIDEKKK